MSDGGAAPRTRPGRPFAPACSGSAMNATCSLVRSRRFDCRSGEGLEDLVRSRVLDVCRTPGLSCGNDGRECSGQRGEGVQHADHVSDADAMMLRVERDPQLRSTITAVLVLDGVPDRVVVLERLDRMSRSVPGYRHRLVSPPLGLATPRWVADRDFDLSYHLRWIAAPEPKSLDTVLEYARQSGMSGLDPDRPLWTFTVVEGLDGGQAAVVVKLHHVLTDGVGGIAMLPFLVDAAREPGDLGPMPSLPTDDVMTRRDLAREALGANAERVTGFLRDAGGLRCAPPSRGSATRWLRPARWPGTWRLWGGS